MLKSSDEITKFWAKFWPQPVRWVKEHQDKRVVIKYGAVIEHDELRGTIAEEIFFTKLAGMHPEIVHGGSTYINEELERVFPGYEAKHTGDGDRITDDEIKSKVTGETEVEVVHRVLSGITYDIVDLLKQYTEGRSIVPIGTEEKNAFFICEQKSEEAKAVGEIQHLEGGLLSFLYNSEVIPVFSPLGYGPKEDGKRKEYNINADTAAAYLAAFKSDEGGLCIPQASKLVFITNVDGIHKDDQLIRLLDLDEARKALDSEYVHEGMIAKVRACIYALERGVAEAHIINGRRPYALLTELFTDKGIGTKIVREK